MNIYTNVKEILSSLPKHVMLEAAAKTRTVEEIETAIDAGVKIIGENYLQEAEDVIPLIGGKARWHYIGQLQSGKIKRIVELFDLVETVGSTRHAEMIDEQAGKRGIIMPILVEVNSGREEQKAGVYPEDAVGLVRDISPMENVIVTGLMTMGRYSSDENVVRSCFRETRSLFDELNAMGLPNVKMSYLSMGMSSSYPHAISEGANLIRVGEAIFGPRK
ncbi:MAG TPA: YggS family pyridoxal phosphate-dependent enzyme [Candidatus Methanofastidiosa archaeon]|nr:YggS family pyridoxal phosphate-dependent enzyme [Candidatus Methanofastidiosa archaeon]HPR42286.1 YggS family pyridoxal phosphate-dependent enzyme [Candidatus Methanofastidiosa archaeon]